MRLLTAVAVVVAVSKTGSPRFSTDELALLRNSGRLRSERSIRLAMVALIARGTEVSNFRTSATFGHNKHAWPSVPLSTNSHPLLGLLAVDGEVDTPQRQPHKRTKGHEQTFLTLPRRVRWYHYLCCLCMQTPQTISFWLRFSRKFSKKLRFPGRLLFWLQFECVLNRNLRDGF